MTTTTADRTGRHPAAPAPAPAATARGGDRPEVAPPPRGREAGAGPAAPDRASAAARTHPAGGRPPHRHGAPDLLAALPYQLGFRPEDCLVAVGLRGPGRDLGLVARIDLEDVLSPAGADLLADVAGHLAADDAVEVVLAVYSEEGDPRGTPHPGGGSAALRATATARAALEPLGTVTAWLVAGDRYLGLDCRDAACCPPGGRRLAELDGGAARRGGGPGRRPLPRRADLASVPVAPAAGRRSAAAARSRWADARLRAAGAPAVLAWRQRSLLTWRTAVAAAREAGRSPTGAAVDLPPAQLGRIEAALDDTTFRDAVVLTLVRPEDDLPDALLRHLPGTAGTPEDVDADDRGHDAGVGEARNGAGGGHAPTAGAEGPSEAASVSAAVRRTLDVLLEPERAEQPREDVATAAREVLEAVVAHGRAGRQAPACTLLALLAWWAGDAVRARLLVDRALAEDPSHRLADLLDRALGVGLAPGWLRRRC